MTKTKLPALLCVAAMLVAACNSTPTDTAEGDRSRLGGKKNGATKGGKPSKKVLKEAAKVGQKAAQKGSGSRPGSATAPKTVGKAPGGTTASSQIRPEFARRSSSVTDPRDDAKKEGVTPDYAEITGASIQGLGEDVRLTMTLAGQVPDRTPNDKTHMIIAFGITGTEENEGYSFGAQARPEGWQAYAGGRDDSGAFPGTFKIEGSQIVMTIPWDYIRGPRAFEWYAASNWFSQLANTTHYRVDLAPSKGLAKFPN
ncbi:MAG TPA: hypothetical protein VG929_01670 [Actinomycetota bacterium]|nr:hypothetical protein [Actinomycetota bacterium]